MIFLIISNHYPSNSGQKIFENFEHFYLRIYLFQVSKFTDIDTHRTLYITPCRFQVVEQHSDNMM